MSIVILKHDMTVTNYDQQTPVQILDEVGPGPDTTRYPNNGPASAGVIMPWAGGWTDNQALRANNALPGRSADLPMGNGPVPGVTR